MTAAELLAAFERLREERDAARRELATFRAAFEEFKACIGEVQRRLLGAGPTPPLWPRDPHPAEDAARLVALAAFIRELPVAARLELASAITEEVPIP